MEALKERTKPGIMDALMPAHAELAAGINPAAVETSGRATAVCQHLRRRPNIAQSQNVPIFATVYQRDVALSPDDTYVRITREDYIVLASLLDGVIQDSAHVLAAPAGRAALGAPRVQDLEATLAQCESTRDRLRAAKDFLFCRAAAADSAPGSAGILPASDSPQSTHEEAP